MFDRIVVSSSVTISPTNAFLFVFLYKSCTILRARELSIDPDDPEWLTLQQSLGIASFVLFSVSQVEHFFLVFRNKLLFENDTQ